LFFAKGVVGIACHADALAVLAHSVSLVRHNGHLKLALTSETADDGGTNLKDFSDLKEGQPLTLTRSSGPLLLLVQGDTLKLARRPLQGTEFFRVRPLPGPPKAFRVWLKGTDRKLFLDYLNIVNADGTEFGSEEVDEKQVPVNAPEFLDAGE
jgi:hypothetical protein